MGCGDEKLSKYLTQTFTAHCNAMICQQVTLLGDAEWPKVADAVIEAKKRLRFPITYTKEGSMSQTLLEMAKDLVLAQIQAKTLPPDDMHQALQHTHTSLLALKAQEDAHGSVAIATPATPPERVHWRKSITKHTVTCLECGASFKQLSVRHLKEHGLDGRSYRVKYGIPRIQSLAAKEI